MNTTDLAMLWELQIALTLSIQKNQGVLSAPEVVRISEELDQLVLKLMQSK